MAIHFRCRSCERRLSVGEHKAGQQVKCPKCQAVLWVPSKEEAAALAAMSGGSGRDLAGYEFDEPQQDAVEVERSPSVPAAQPSSDDRDLVALPRRLLYAQGALIALVALLAFVLGYFAGQGERVAPAPELGAAPVHAAGTLTYAQPSGAVEPDAGAVVILLPHGKLPDERIPVAGLGPLEPPVDEDHPAVRALESLGGLYQRTDNAGRFRLSLPRAGRYYLLRLSKHARRPAHVPIRGEDLVELNVFFQPAAELLGEQQYRWDVLDLPSELSLDQTFR